MSIIGVCTYGLAVRGFVEAHRDLLELLVKQYKTTEQLSQRIIKNFGGGGALAWKWALT